MTCHRLAQAPTRMGSLTFTLYPNTEIRINYGDPILGQTGRLFLPTDFMVGRNVLKDVTLSLEVSVR